MQSLPQARRWLARATLAQAGLALQARAVASTRAPEAAPIPARAAEPTQDPAVVRTLGQEVGLIRGQVVVYTRARAAAPTQVQVAARTLGRAVVLRLLRVAGATAGLVVAGRINGIGLILIVS